MKSKTSESLIASESKAGIRRDGADEHKQKQLKKGKGTDGTGRKNRRIVSSKQSFYSTVDDVNNPLFYVGQHPSVILRMDRLRSAAIDFR